jgi:hypothetical protein
MSPYITTLNELPPAAGGVVKVLFAVNPATELP